MDEQTNNVGGSNMGMAPLAPGQPMGDQAAHSGGVFPGAQPPADFYTQPPAGAGNHESPVAASQNVGNVNQSNNGVVNTTVPSSADDSDLIEKEWVEKAKLIVEKTRKDPFLQSQELNRFKTEYLHKRYGKNIGSGE